MDSCCNQSFQTQNNQPSSGLLRFRSAPSSFLANFNDIEVTNDSVLSFNGVEDKSGVKMRESSVSYEKSTAHSSSYSGLPPHYPRQNSATNSAAINGCYGLIGSIGLTNPDQPKRMDSNLARQNSSPAGFLANISVQDGYASIKGIGSYAGANRTNGDLSPRLKTQLSFPQRVHSSLNMLSQIAEMGNESVDISSPDSGKLGISSYGSWNESIFSDDFNPQNGELGNHANLLSHHLSLPKTSTDMYAVEKFLHLQDSVPCKIRAKRGCATHPRSIAERLRRTRISERMRKLQELVPNMDKQTNTSDMLDLAVDYIKNLQKQYKILGESRAKCKCLSKQTA